VLRRGFKAEAEKRAVAVRRELGLQPTDALLPEQLASHLGVEYRSAEDLVPLAALEELDRLQPGCFSACTLPGKRGPVVVVNPLDSPARRLSDAMHELSHIMLHHETRRLERIAGLAFLTCDPVQEEEANHLAGTLLLPRPLLVAVFGRGMNAQAIADTYGVSEQLARWRLNASGVVLQQQRRQVTG
jgi:IrrE N-terminal-like domain